MIDSWRRLGPARVKRQLALHLGDLDRRHLLRLDDPDIAAVHDAALTSSAVGSALEPDPSPERAVELMHRAVAAFLRGYAVEPSGLVRRGGEA